MCKRTPQTSPVIQGELLFRLVADVWWARAGPPFRWRISVLVVVLHDCDVLFCFYLRLVLQSFLCQFFFYFSEVQRVILSITDFFFFYVSPYPFVVHGTPVCFNPPALNVVCPIRHCLCWRVFYFNFNFITIWLASKHFTRLHPNLCK